jgi:hypothetical protein
VRRYSSSGSAGRDDEVVGAGGVGAAASPRISTRPIVTWTADEPSACPVSALTRRFGLGDGLKRGTRAGESAREGIASVATIGAAVG